MTQKITYEDVHIKTSEVFKRLRHYQKKIILLRWGSSSTKTFSTLERIWEWLLTGKFLGQEIPVGVATIGRKFAASLKGSVMKDWEDILSKNEWWDYVDHNKTDRRYYHGRRYVEFIGLDDPRKLRGPRRQIGYLNEVNECDFEDFFQFEMRTRCRLVIDFNPDDEDHWVKTEIEDKRRIVKGDVDVDISTYKDNPFLTQAEIDSIEYYKEVDPIAWAVYGLGHYGKIEGRVFDTIYEVDDIDDDWKFCGHGMDFGYTNDPTTLVQMFERNWGKEILFDELIYETWLTNPDISALIKEYEIPDEDDIIADSSEPKSIRELKDFWHNIHPVKKWEDSIRFGISLMKARKIYVTRSSYHLLREFKKYVWKKLSNGKYARVPIDKNNHAIDGARYVCMWHFWEREPEPDIYIW